MDSTNRPRRITLSLALWILVCFFMPWAQLSCVGIRDSVSGYDLARGGDNALWFVPLFMLLILILGLMRWVWEKLPALFALTSTVGGGLSAYLIFHEYYNLTDAPNLVATRWTIIFWLGFIAALALVAVAFWFYIERTRAP